jgi:hypothetical protein
MLVLASGQIIEVAMRMRTYKVRTNTSTAIAAINLRLIDFVDANLLGEDYFAQAYGEQTQICSAKL